MQTFSERMTRHAEHVKTAGPHCASEETTKQALILPFLDILGFSPFDPTKVKAEHGADFPGAKANERVDYALFCHAVPVMFIEAKAYNENLTNHCPQLSRYFNATPEVTIAAITNGREWRFFTDLENKNVMDQAPFLTIDFDNLDVSMLDRIYRFRHDEFQPEALRTLAEESIYLTAFARVISSSLRAVDSDFVRYVAGRAGIQRQFNQRFIESITPLVRQAVERAISETVVSGLSSAPAAPLQEEPSAPARANEEADIVDPENSRIVTTYAERRVFDVVRDILGGDVDLQAKDTETYYNVLHQGKSTRWIVRYFGNKKNPTVVFPVEMTPDRRAEVSRAGLQFSAGDAISLPSPEALLRISGIVFDAFEYCKNDDNFRRAGGGETA